MICEACKAGLHTACISQATCPCQHRRTEHMEDGTITPLSARDALLKEGQELTAAGGWTTVGLMMIEEAAASTRMDREGDGQTIALEGPVTVGDVDG